MGSGRRLAGRRRPRCAVAQRQGACVRLGWRQRDGELSRAGPHARDGVGSCDGFADARQRRHGLQRLLQRVGAPGRRSPLPCRRKQGPGAQRHRPDPPLRSVDEHVEPGTEHGGRALVSVGDAVAQRRDADHLGPCRHAGGADTQRRAANAEHGIAEPAAVSMDGRRAGRPGVLFRPRPDVASARHDRHRRMADARAARLDQPRLRRPRDLRRRQDARRRRRSVDDRLARRRFQRRPPRRSPQRRRWPTGAASTT